MRGATSIVLVCIALCLASAGSAAAIAADTVLRTSSPASETPPYWTPGQSPKPAADAARSDGREPGPRDFLRLLNVAESDFEKFVDGQPIDKDEHELLAGLLFAVRRIDVELVGRWAQQSGELDWRSLSRNAAARRGEFFGLRGHVTKVTLERPRPELAERLELQRFYRCLCEAGDERRPFVVYAIETPRAWPLDVEFREPISVQGMYFKLSGGGGNAPTFAAVRLAWHPENLLGQLNLDAGLLDGVAHNTKLHTSYDRDAFYQLLAGTDRVPAAEIEAAARRALAGVAPGGKPDEPPHFAIPTVFAHAKEVETLREDLHNLKQLGQLAARVLSLERQKTQAQAATERAALATDLQEVLDEVKTKAQAVQVPADVMANLGDLEAWIEARLAETRAKLSAASRSPYAQGQPMIFEGTARRAIRVRVDEPLLQERFGLDHYYEVILFAELGRTYQLEGSDLRIDSAPVHVCVRELPPDMPLGDSIHEQVQVAGVFLKVFPFTPRMAEQSGADERHLAPLIVAGELTWFRPQSRNHYQFAIIAATLFLLVLAGIALWSWRTRKADSNARAKLRAVHDKSGRGTSLNDLKLD